MTNENAELSKMRKDYTLGAFRRTNLNECPLEQFSEWMNDAKSADIGGLLQEAVSPLVVGHVCPPADRPTRQDWPVRNGRRPAPPGQSSVCRRARRQTAACRRR